MCGELHAKLIRAENDLEIAILEEESNDDEEECAVPHTVPETNRALVVSNAMNRLVSVVVSPQSKRRCGFWGSGGIGCRRCMAGHGWVGQTRRQAPIPKSRRLAFPGDASSVPRDTGQFVYVRRPGRRCNERASTLTHAGISLRGRHQHLSPKQC